MTEIVIGAGTKVTLHFSLKLEDGEVVDSNFEGEPATFTVGDGNLLPGFEEQIFGLKAGDKGEYSVPPEKGFGQPNPNNIQRVSVETFKDMELTEGLVVGFQDASGGEVPGVIKQIDGGEV